MPFLRYTRDKRGYEHVYLIQPTAGRKGKIRSRILYWYRTPPGVKVGRDPFDEEIRRAIEKQYPDVEFDWPKLLATPKPPAANGDIERWRERRRQAKAERAAAAAEAAEVPATAEAGESAEPDAELSETEADIEERVGSPAESLEESTPGEFVAAEPATAAEVPAGEAPKKRRRRRRHRRRADASASNLHEDDSAARAEANERREPAPEPEQES